MFLQFGTSRFLQAHADLIISESGLQRAICVVQSSGSAATADRLKHLDNPAGYPVRIQGQTNGTVVDHETVITSVGKTLSTHDNWDAVIEQGKTCQFILSNVSEAGYHPRPADARPVFDNSMSFVAKLTLLLLARFDATAPPCHILPLELFPDNGQHLRRLVQAQAQTWDAASAAVDGLGAHIWVNSLVDRIVSEPLDPVGAITEPYCLWAIENSAGLALPFADHPAVDLTDDLKTHERLKLFLLNLSHTYMAEIWKREALPADMLVKDFVSDATLHEELKDVIHTEVLPVFAQAGLGVQAQTYFEITLERFANPFLRHKISDIAGGHKGKVASRLGSFLTWSKTFKTPAQAPRLTAIVTTYTA